MSVDVTSLKAYQTMPALKSADTEWIKWSDLIFRKYGNDLGKQLFINVWEKRGSKAANTYALRSHLKDEYNIEIDESVWDKIVDVGGGIGDTFGKIFKMGKITILVVGGVALLIVGLTVYNNLRATSGGLKK